MIVWGGSPLGAKTFADGARYDYWTDTWPKLRDAPIAGRVPQGMVRDGKSMYVMSDVRGEFQDGAKYEIGGSWTKIASIPESVLTSANRTGSVIWFGDRLRVW